MRLVAKGLNVPIIISVNVHLKKIIIIINHVYMLAFVHDDDTYTLT